jgi:predicted transcriptional regulator
MNFEANDMKVLGAVVGGGKTFKDIKTTTRLDKAEQEKILGFLVQSKLIIATEGTNFLGQLKYYFGPTEEGKKKVDEYIEELKEEWKKIIQFVTDGQRQELDEYMKQHKLLVNMMLFFKIINLPALGRLNLRFLIEGKHLCYKCKKGLTTHDDLCADCFDGLAVR